MTEPPPAAGATPLRVLVADDDRATRLLLQRSLASWGCEVVAVGDGDRAWEALREGDFRVVITDWEMPGLDGPALCRVLRQRENSDYVFLILVTARDRKGDIVAALRAGADDFITKPFDRAELRVRLEVARRVLRLEDSLKVRNRELLEANTRLARIASTDPLMGIGNRRSFEQRAEAAQGSDKGGYALLMMDLDRFKAFNDRYGHPAGDNALASVAAVANRKLRGGDALFRYGGEELVAILPGASLEAAVMVGERLRQSVEASAIPHSDNAGGVVTISVGASVWSGDPAETWSEVLGRADRALYRAKQEGRNLVLAA